MRISDWSSDVCSSDLLNHAKETAHARHVKGPAESRRRRARCKARRTAEIQAQGGVQADGGIHDGESARGVCEHQAQGTAGQERLSAFAQSWIIPLRRTRSEEHTSELQSLMRISYAGFCLKKKMNTN